MQTTDKPNKPLSRQIRGLTVLTGLAGAVCLVGTLVAPTAGRLPLVVTGTIAVLSVPFVRLRHMRRRLGALASIERQLVDLEMGGSNSAEIRPISTVDAASSGWNRLVSLSADWRALRNLEESVSRKLADTGNGSAANILDGLGEGVAVTDVDGRLAIINEALSAIVRGDDAQDIHGKPLLDVLDSVLGDQNADLVEEFAATSRPVSINLNRDVDGARHVLRCSRRPQWDENHNLTGHVWTVRDVTQQRLAEEMREQFVSTASHELRTPLANIRAYAETLTVADGIDVEKQKEFCNTIQSEATRLGRLVDDLLDVTRMQVGSMILDRHETDVERLLQEVCRKVNGQILQKQIEFRTEFPAKLPKLNIDKDKISASLVNLLGNAVKYTPEQAEIELRVEVDAHQISFSVEDTGFGIAENELPRVFEKFFRSDDERVRSVSGSGLGLAFTKEVARLHGGDVTVHSELDKGTRFTFSIPLTKENL
ncbi:MAG: sensor histidine kinase [Planctomycetaceae bacterium]